MYNRFYQLRDRNPTECKLILEIPVDGLDLLLLDLEGVRNIATRKDYWMPVEDPSKLIGKSSGSVQYKRLDHGYFLYMWGC